MTKIELIAKDQELTADEKPVVASGNQNTVVIEVDYSDEWEGYAKSAVFFTENNSTAYEVAMDDNSCIIPHEVLADVTKLYIGLRGVNGDEVKASSLVRWNIVKGAPVGEGTAVEATPTPYQQVLERTVSLQGQIDGIVIEATGSGDASAEVAQARTPEYGSPYGTLQARLNAADETDRFILDKIGDTYAEKILDNWNLSSYINTSGEIGSTVDVTPIHSGAWRSMVVPVVAGDVFKVTGRGGLNSRLWAFLDTENVLLSQSATSVNVTDKELTAEADGYLVVNINDNIGFSFRRVYKTVETAKADRFEVEQLERLTLKHVESGVWEENGHYCDISGLDTEKVYALGITTSINGIMTVQAGTSNAIAYMIDTIATRDFRAGEEQLIFGYKPTGNYTKIRIDKSQEWAVNVYEVLNTDEAINAEISRLETDILSVEENLIDFENNSNLVLLNAVDTENQIAGKYYSGGGGIASADTYYYSETYVMINPNTLYGCCYWADSRFIANSKIAFCFYDSKKRYISQHYNISEIVSPANARYMRISWQKVNSAQIMFYESKESGYIPEKYNSFGYGLQSIEDVETRVGIVERDVDDIETRLTAVTETVEILNDITNYVKVPNYFLYLDGTEWGEYTNWEYYKIPVSYREKYTVSADAGQNARLWLMLKEDGTVYSNHRDNEPASAKSDTITIDSSDVKYLCVNHRNNAGVPVSLKKHSTLVGLKPSVVADLMNQNCLYGKTLVCCGDSITQGIEIELGENGFDDNPKIDVYRWAGTSDTDGSWVKQTSSVRRAYGYQIASRNGMIFYNGGISGSTIQGIIGKHGFSLENGRYTKLPEQIDYLTIFFGWNDNAYGSLGTITDTTNDTYYGAYNVVLPYLIEKYPYTKICLIVPFGATSGHRNAIRQLANKYGLGCFDMYGAGTPLYYGKETEVGVNSDIVTANRAKFQANGAHPNSRGHKQIADMLENFLRGL